MVKLFLSPFVKLMFFDEMSGQMNDDSMSRTRIVPPMLESLMAEMVKMRRQAKESMRIANKALRGQDDLHL